jgi:hypothetical protein
MNDIKNNPDKYSFNMLETGGSNEFLLHGSAKQRLEGNLFVFYSYIQPSGKLKYTIKWATAGENEIFSKTMHGLIAHKELKEEKRIRDFNLEKIKKFNGILGYPSET